MFHQQLTQFVLREVLIETHNTDVEFLFHRDCILVMTKEECACVKNTAIVVFRINTLQFPFRIERMGDYEKETEQNPLHGENTVLATNRR